MATKTSDKKKMKQKKQAAVKVHKPFGKPLFGKSKNATAEKVMPQSKSKKIPE